MGLNNMANQLTVVIQNDDENPLHSCSTGSRYQEHRRYNTIVQQRQQVIVIELDKLVSDGIDFTAFERTR